MADGAVRWARRVSDIEFKTGLRACLKTGTLWHKGTRRLSSLSVRFLLETLGNTSGTGAGSVWDSHTRVKPVVSALNTCYQGELATFYQPKCKVRIQKNVRRLFDNPWSSNCYLIFIRAYSGNGGFQEPLYKSKTGYYDILVVSPNATQAQIKTAYYKQSFAYHPDRNAGSEEATLRFSEINEAYTVLGNKALRKKYDRGLLSSSDLTASARPSTKDSSTTSPTKPHTDPKRSVVDQEGSGRVFDFDKFIKAHYGDQLHRERDIRVRKEAMQRRKEEGLADQTSDRMMGFGVGLLLVMALGILISLKRA